MSWDVSIQRFSRNYTSIEEIPETEQLVPLGSRMDVHKAISKYFPETDWAEPAWAIFDASSGSIEFNMGADEPNTGFMLHVRATSDIVPAIVAMCRDYGWQALDCSSGEFLENAQDPKAGLEAWSDYRKQVLLHSRDS